MSPIEITTGRKAAWRKYLEWLCNATIEELEQLDSALRHLPARMSLMQAIEHALNNDWRRQAMPESLLRSYGASDSPACLLAAA